LAVQSLLDAISTFCRRECIAESTFGRRAVNDGKFVSRLRDGARITPATFERLHSYMSQRGMELPNPTPSELLQLIRPAELAPPSELITQAPAEPGRNFRFFDNRQKYLLFVHTCGEKRVAARRVGLELSNIHPQPPAIRVFDAGMGDGTVLAGVMREMHRRFPTMPFYVVGKEISLEDVRLSLARMADRFHEHPSTVLVVTNMYYTEAPWLTPRSANVAKSIEWREVALMGTSAHEFAEQIASLDGFLDKHWQARHNPKTGNPVYERPVVLIVYREDYRFLPDDVIPRQSSVRAAYDLVIASQPYRARAALQFQRLCRHTRNLSLRHAYAAYPKYLQALARRRCLPPGMLPSMLRKLKMTAWRLFSASVITSPRRRRCCKGTLASGFLTNLM
jgi:hypothetical protein